MIGRIEERRVGTIMRLVLWINRETKAYFAEEFVERVSPVRWVNLGAASVVIGRPGSS